jgi:hypothetical protein
MPSGHEGLHGHGFDRPMKQLARPGPKIMQASERCVQLPAPYDGQRVRRLLPHAGLDMHARRLDGGPEDLYRREALRVHVHPP